ncbi:MAG: hypothetical protein WDO15_10840 [Bacteroidota bacterium]
MMSDEIEDNYKNSGFDDTVKIVGYVSFLAITLACLGMLGMAMYSTQTRVKEIGIRKVMGAESWQVVMVLSRSFLGIDRNSDHHRCAGWLFRWQYVFWENFVYKISISLGLIATGVLTIVILGSVTIASQTLRAARANPVKFFTLRIDQLLSLGLNPLKMAHGLLIDMDGVIYGGNVLIPGADKFIERLLNENIPFTFMTNNSQRTQAGGHTQTKTPRDRSRRQAISTPARWLPQVFSQARHHTEPCMCWAKAAC